MPISEVFRLVTKTHIVECIVATVLFLLSFVMDFMSGHKMDIPQERSNPNVSFKNTTNTIPSLVCLIASLALPTVFIVLFSRKRGNKTYLITVLICFWFSFALNEFLTNIFKLFAGRPRPNFYAVYDAGDQADAYKSFPSGHSSMTFCAMMFLSLLLCGEFKVFSGSGSLLKVVMCISPLILAGFVALTRTRDYFHNFDDILGGVLIGSIISFICYTTKFKTLWGNNAGDIDEDQIEFDDGFAV
ncbi:phosphatidic acid phosphatase type 2 domain containing protein 1B, putative [Entamoeba invadens IP1]|uniref:phosphatidic acid phosphatase type 2 domain containing protein 1B, putative n=1 Tax=Entamoeba invadens IP1 TaxID=370355 RepID=UPI0002C3E9D6|nr:phosphatidic acid phosphatase type 2 domain containing protein 1B, putative [Entamoeba invadens IP1]ELP94103.1 phosphatidic acid phosphatase type 2 domain containing protein 1B, putative [Entamoeba invadens IP1]|eukprot:XP_004260874.1 phosphatidic acid phosphatase type 2 domain containing protein 1B, putative [Entamoeba invadens IP1]